MSVNKRLRVAILATITDFGGAEKITLSLIENLSRNRFELMPIIFTRRTGLTNDTFLKRLNEMHIKYFIIYTDNFRFKYLNPFFNIYETYKLIKRFNINLIHTNGHRADVIGFFLSNITRRPVIATCHGFIHSETSKLKIYIAIDRLVLKSFNKIIAVSANIKEELVKSGILASRVLEIPNAVDVKPKTKSTIEARKKIRGQFNITENDFVIGFIGRLSEEKGIKYLFDAALMLKHLNLTIKILVIGSGPQINELKAFVKNANMQDHIHFAGFQFDVDYWMSAIDVLALPSLTEGTPMVLLEAMANGLPIVASSVGGVPKIIDTLKNGLLVPPRDSENLKNALHLLYKDESLRKKLSTEAQQTIKSKYGIEDWITKIETVYSTEC